MILREHMRTMRQDTMMTLFTMRLKAMQMRIGTLIRRWFNTLSPYASYNPTRTIPPETVIGDY